MQQLSLRLSTIFLLAFTGAVISMPAAAQSGPSDRVCILLAMLGVPCGEPEEEDAAPPAGNIAAMAYHSQATVFSLPAFQPVSRSHSTLIRTSRGATATMNLAEIRPANVFTLWWIVFNNPQACSARPCLPQDLGNPDTGPSFFGAGSGRVSDEFGHVRLEAGIVAGAGLPEDVDDVFFGEGLTAPLTAEVQLVVRDHGNTVDLADDGALEAALSKLLGGGCPFVVTDNPDEHDCREPAIAFHLPQSAD